MNNPSINSQVFNPILDKGEKLLWTDKPHFWAFLATGVPFLIMGLCWGAFDYSVFKGATRATPFMLFHLAPFFLSVGNILRLLLVYQNTYYGITNRRLLFRGGFFGIDCKSIEFDKIQSLEVNINPLENVLRVGTIRAQLASAGYNNKTQTQNFIGIVSPYDIYKKVKEASTMSRESQVLV
jgi:uncharacterized membrane protein YdbT with pleckstrin-like domain